MRWFKGTANLVGGGLFLTLFAVFVLQVIARFVAEARDRARFRDPDHDCRLALLPEGLPWKTLIVLLLLAWCCAP